MCCMSVAGLMMRRLYAHPLEFGVSALIAANSWSVINFNFRKCLSRESDSLILREKNLCLKK